MSDLSPFTNRVEPGTQYVSGLLVTERHRCRGGRHSST